MLLDEYKKRDEPVLIRMVVVLGVVAVIVVFTLSRISGARSDQVSADEVWAYLQEQAPKQGLDQEFVYALAWAESRLNARARSSEARGIMQLTKPTWQAVSEKSYRHAWDWRTNMRVGIDYLVFCRDYLKKHDSFSYPLLAASYRYGPYYVKSQHFKIRRLKEPRNEIYKRIFEGNICPVAPPQ